MSETEFDPKRRLCPDGACVGVMKDDGHCSVCGRDASGAAAAAAAQEANEDADELFAEGGGAPAAGGGASAFDPNRRLCDDGSCVGIIGEDGRCGVCGQPAA